MPDPRDNAQQRGDIHPPEIESDLPFEEGMPDSLGTEATPAGRGKAAERGSKHAGQLKDAEAPQGDTGADARGPGKGAAGG